MNCKNARKLMVDYSENSLAGGKKRDLENHLSTCEPCRHELSRIEELRENIRSLEVPERDAEFWQSFNEKLSEELARAEHVPAGSRPAWQPRIAFAAAIATILLITGLALIGLVLLPESPEQREAAPVVASGTGQTATPEIEDLKIEFFIRNGDNGTELALVDLSDEEVEDFVEGMFLLTEEDLQDASEDMVLDNIYEETVYDDLEELSVDDLEEVYRHLELT